MNGQSTQSSPQPRTWQETQWDRSAGIRHAALAAGLDRVQKASKLNRRLVKKMQDGTLGKQTTEPEDDEEDDGVHVGDITINMPQPALEPRPVQPQSPPANPVSPAAPAPSSGISKTAAAALIAASLLGGTGAGALLYSLVRPVPKVTDTDTDTQYNLRLVDDLHGQ